MTEKHYPYCGGSFDRIIFDKDGSVWVPETENAKLRELAERAWKTAERMCQAFDGPCRDDGVTIYTPCPLGERDEECVYGLLQRDLRELGIEVDV